jgi:SWI/SNF-related matrix-associated actin-dependent regulator 1 of chromatin subfamily A
LSDLRPYQVEGAAFLARTGRALLADEQRVGKTGSVIGGADNIGAEDVLEITKGSARGDHERAWRRFQKQKRPVSAIYSGSDRLPDRGVTIISYDLAAGDFAEKLFNRKWDIVWLDESHRLGTRTTKRTKFVYGEKCEGDGIVAKAPNVWCASGTPAPRDYSQLWPMCRAVMPDVIEHKGKPMNYWAFVNKYCVLKDNGFGLKIVGNKNADDLKRRLAPRFLRRKFKEVGGSDLIFDTLALHASDTLRELKALERDDLVREVAARLEKASSDQARAAILKTVDQKLAMRLRRITGTAKVKPAVEWLKEQVDDGVEKIVVFAWHKDVLRGLYDGLGGAKACILIDGDTPAKDRQPLVDRFHNDRACHYAIGQIEAAGEAIDLSAADEAVFVEWSYVPGPNEQASYRIQNINKPKPGLVRFASLAGSIDDRIASVCAWRAADIARLFG